MKIISTDQQTNLVKTAIYMLRDNVMNFDMFSYFDNGRHHPSEVQTKEQYVCGTSCCFAGFGPAAFGKVQPGDMWDTYICRELTNGDDFVWHFLFDSDWSSNKLEAASRLLAFLKDENIAEEWYLESGYACNAQSFDEVYHTGESVEELISQLEKFIVE